MTKSDNMRSIHFASLQFCVPTHEAKNPLPPLRRRQRTLWEIKMEHRTTMKQKSRSLSQSTKG